MTMSLIALDIECCYAECRNFYYYTECRYAKCRYDACRGAFLHSS
jgi:hypothetical protein